jgi:biotin carboxylase
MNKTLLVLAASIYQVPVILTAQKLGYRVITTDNVPSNPGHSLAHASFDIDTTDIDGILQLAKQENISGIISPATDVAVLTAAVVASELGLQGPNKRAAQILTNKYLFRELQREKNWARPRYVSIHSEDTLFNGDFFEDRTWLIKPAVSSGSKGIYILRDQESFKAHIKESLSYSIEKTAILENFIEGSQHTCEGILQRGQFVLSLITDRLTASPPYVGTRGHIVPTLLSLERQNAALASIKSVLDELEITDGLFDCDFVDDGDTTFILEMTPRLGGNSLYELIRSTLGIDMIEYAVKYACNDLDVALFLKPFKAMALLVLGVEKNGRLSWDEKGVQKLTEQTWLLKFSLDLPRGAAVTAFANGRHRVGEALIFAANRAELDKRMSQFQQMLALKAV